MAKFSVLKHRPTIAMQKHVLLLVFAKIRIKWERGWVSNTAEKHFRWLPQDVSRWMMGRQDVV